MIDVRSGSLGGVVQGCSEDYPLCSSDPDGAVSIAYGNPGLTFIVVDGHTPGAAGEYQMSVIY